MHNEAVTKDSVAYYAGCRVIEAVLLNLGCERGKPVAWLDLTMMSPIRMFVLKHLRYDLIVPGRNETASVITMRPRDAERLDGSTVTYRVELVPLKTDEDFVREKRAKQEGREVGTDYPNRAAFQALLDQTASINRHWCGEVEMIRLYHHEAPQHSVHCPNDAFAPAPHMSLAEVAKALAAQDDDRTFSIVERNGEFELVEDEDPAQATSDALDPEKLEFDLTPDPPPQETTQADAQIVEMTADEPPMELQGRHKILLSLSPDICPAIDFDIDARHASDLERINAPLDQLFAIRFT